ncbi:hypothetical protein NPIL_73731, partial [Nephila pilipes]
QNSESNHLKGWVDGSFTIESGNNSLIREYVNACEKALKFSLAD